MVAKDLFDSSAALLNDTALSVFTYVAQTPYLNIALKELQEELQLNNVPVTNRTPAVITITTGKNGIGGGAGNPDLPADFVEPLNLKERTSGNQFAFVDMKRVDFLPPNQVPSAYLIYWSYENEVIKFISGGATGPVDILLHYMASLFPKITDSNSFIRYDKGETFLIYRLAALCAEFIGENKNRSDELNLFAGTAIQRALGITTKGRQSIATRRRPFMAGWRSRRIL